MNIAYVRVSTVEQNEARQVEGLKKHNIDKWFTEKISAKDANRPQLAKELNISRPTLDKLIREHEETLGA